MRNLTGPDADIETSLKEYGMAWQEKGEDLVVYYGVEMKDENFVAFDWSSFPLHTDIKKEFDWVDWEAMNDFIGGNILELSLEQQLKDLASFYGTENIFGTSYGFPMSYCEVVTGRKIKQKSC